MKTLFLTLSMMALTISILHAQHTPADDRIETKYTPALGKEVFVPRELAKMDLSADTSQFSFARAAYTPDLVMFWEKPFGKDPSQAPDLNGKTMKIDVQQMLKRTQYFYDFFVDSLKWTLPGSKAERYRMMIMVRYNEDGTAYGGAYDNTIGALWVSPSRLQDTLLNVLAHELGHSFQAQLGADGTQGLNQGALWEMTSQWMLWQVNPDWVTSENYHWVEFMKQTSYAFCHRLNIYRSPYVLEYFSTKHGREYIGKLWREAQQGEDIAAAYIRLSGITQQAFNAEMYDAATRFITYDFPRVKKNMEPYANRHHCKMIDGDNGTYHIAPERALGAYGYNGIRLETPAPGKKLSIQLQPDSLTKGATGGWNYGLVAVTPDGTPHYTSLTYVPATGKQPKAISYKAPKEGLSYLWLVVSSAPETHTIDPNAEWHAHFTMKGTKPHEDMYTAPVSPIPAPETPRRR